MTGVDIIRLDYDVLGFPEWMRESILEELPEYKIIELGRVKIYRLTSKDLPDPKKIFLKDAERRALKGCALKYIIDGEEVKPGHIIRKSSLVYLVLQDEEIIHPQDDVLTYSKQDESIQSDSNFFEYERTVEKSVETDYDGIRYSEANTAIIV